MTLYAATNNPGKLAEFRASAAGAGIRVEPAPGVATLPPCVEDGATFEENARKKAEYYSRDADGSGFDGLVFADDSGLEVPALAGAPGVYSARYSGPDATAASNNQKLLRALEGKPPTERLARFVCVIALARRGRTLGTFEGAVEGLVAYEPAGAGGFGYDPLFLMPEIGRTFGEIAPDQKLRFSHRGRAFRLLVQALPALEGSESEKPKSEE